MAIRGIDQVRKNMARTFSDITGPMTEKTITEILIIGGGLADVMTPRDLGNLVNSRYRIVHPSKTGWTGKYGYTANYAAAVHALSGKLKGQPRSSVKAFNTKTGATGFASDSGNFWDPEGEPQWLQKGFEMSMDDIKAAIKRNMQL